MGRKGAPARVVKRTPEARIIRDGIENIPSVDTSDMALTNLLERLSSGSNPDEIRQLSEQIERVVFHKQFANA